MDYNQFAETVKAKYPQYKDRDNRALAEAMVNKFPAYGDRITFDEVKSDSPRVEGAGERAAQLFGAVTSPLSAVPDLIRNRQEVFNKGPAVGMTVGGLLGGIPGAALGAGAGEAFKQLDTRALGTPEAKASLPQTGKDAAMDIGVEGAKGAALEAGGKLAGGIALKAWPMLKNVGQATLKAILRVGGKVPEKALEAGAKAGWKVPNVSPEEVNTAVSNVQGALKSVVDDAGKLLNEAKSNIGLPTTVAEREASIAKYGNPFGIGKPDMETGALTQYFKDFTKPEELVSAIKTFKDASKGLPKQMKAKVAAHLQDQINGKVNWEGKGTVTEGVLKSLYKDLGNFINESVPKALRERMSKALALEDDLGKMLGEGEGKAEQFLRNLFASKSAGSKDTLQRLADLEVLTGQPVLTELFRKFSGQELNKLVGREFIAFTAGTSAISGAISGNPTVAGVGAALLTGQSPWAMTRIGRLAVKGSGVAEKIGPAALQGFKMLAQNQELEKVKQKLKGRR